MPEASRKAKWPGDDGCGESEGNGMSYHLLDASFVPVTVINPSLTSLHLVLASRSDRPVWVQILPEADTKRGFCAWILLGEGVIERKWESVGRLAQPADTL